MSDGHLNSFRTTRWSRVVAAKGSSTGAKAALRELCETYYAPLEQFIRRYQTDGDRNENARELTHEFVSRLLQGNELNNADPAKGRFRSYLLGAVKHFLAGVRTREKTVKRGGGCGWTSIDLRDGSTGRRLECHDGVYQRLPIVDPTAFPSDAFFDRQWALTVVELAMSELREESVSNGDESQFEILKNWLVASANHHDSVSAARALDMTEGAFKVAVHRLRKRFRQIVTEHIAATVDDPNEVSDELNYLIQAIASANRT